MSQQTEKLGPYLPNSKKGLIFWMEPEEIDRLTTDIQKDMIDNTKLQLVFDDKNFTGGLSKSIEGEADGLWKSVVVNSPYGFAVEFGIGPGTVVPFPKMLAWVMGKLGITDKNAATHVAYKIRSKILGEGIKPSRFFKKAILRFGRKNKLRAQRAKYVRPTHKKQGKTSKIKSYIKKKVYK